ncbi:MAG: RHS repeat protein [Planctomycetes bacterium]|nr:RHS repeat protein [Planctomycetota bacterium]
MTRGLRRKHRFLTSSLRLVLAAGLALQGGPLLAIQAQALQEGTGATGACDLTEWVNVSLEEGALRLAAVDAPLGAGSGLSLDRLYDSNSLRPGMLGVGWRFDFEAELEDLGETLVVDGPGPVARSFEADPAAGAWVAVSGAADRIERTDEGWVLRAGEAVTSFDLDGRLLRREAASGTLEVERDEAGRITALRADGGAVTRFRYGEAGRLVGAVDPLGREVGYEVNEAGDLVSARDVAGRGFRYGYDREHRLTAVNGSLLVVSYDAGGLVASLAGDGVRPLAFEYGADDEGHWGVVVDPAAGRSLTRWSEDGRTVETTGPDGRVSRVVLDERRRVVERTAAGVSLRYRYDERGDLAAVVDAAGGAVTYERDEARRVVKLTDPAGRATRFSYDAAGRLASVKRPGGSTEVIHRDEAGRIAEVTDARGTTRFERDASGRVLRVVRPDGGVGSMSYDAAGRPTRVRTPEGEVFEAAWDALGHPLFMEDGRGRRVEFEYSDMGALVRARENDGTVRHYDAAGRVGLRVDPAGGEVRYERDAAGRLLGRTDQNGNTYVYERDEVGRVAALVDAAGGRETFHYDAAGRVEAVEGPDGRRLEFGYDALGRQVATFLPDGGTDAVSYDAVGRVVAMKNADASYEMVYDEAGRMVRLVDRVLGATLSYEYNLAGERTKMTGPFGTVTYGYDGAGRLTALIDPAGRTTKFAHDGEGRMVRADYPNGVRTTYAWGEGATLDEVKTVDREGRVLQRHAYTYDARSRRSSETMADGSTRRYEYDGSGRLVKVVSPEGEQSLSYDAAGNLLREGGDVFRYDKDNRLVTKGDIIIAYDDAGRVQSREGPEGVTRYDHDARGKLRRVGLPDGTEVRYGYAPNGARVWREAGGVRTRYLHDFEDVVAEFRGEAPEGTEPRPGRVFLHGPDVDDPVALLDADGASYYYHADGLGSVSALSDAGGRLAASYQYDAWGRTTASTGEVDNPLRYTARWWDGEAGLYDHRARQYSPELARFTTRDPSGFAGGDNLYAYAGSSPLSATDPWGLDDEPWYSRLWGSVKSGASAAGGWVADRASDTWEGTRSAASWVGDRAVDAGNWVAGTTAPARQWVAGAATDVWAVAREVPGALWEDFASGAARDRIFAFGRGFGQGTWGAAKGIWYTVRHPIQTGKAIYGAIENWEQTREVFLAKWDEYIDALHNDPERFAEMTGALTAEVMIAVAGTKGLDKLSKAQWVGRAGQAARASRAASVVRTVAGGTARTVRAGMGRVPGGSLVYGAGAKLTGAAARLVGTAARGTWTVGRKSAVPLIVALNDDIERAARKYETYEAAKDDLRAAARLYLESVDGGFASEEDLARATQEVASAFDQYRAYLFRPVHEADRRLQDELVALDRRVGERGEPREPQLDNLAQRYARERERILTEVYTANRSEAPFVADGKVGEPSTNRLEAYDHERALYAEALRRARDDRTRALLERLLEDVRAAKDSDAEAFALGATRPEEFPGEGGTPEGPPPPEEGVIDALDGVGKGRK